MCAAKKKPAGEKVPEGKSSVGKQPIPKKARVKKSEDGGDEVSPERRADARRAVEAHKRWKAKADERNWRAVATMLAFQDPKRFTPPEDVTIDDIAGWMEASPEDVRRWLRLPKDSIWPPKKGDDWDW
jgi:hypothetical protein